MIEPSPPAPRISQPLSLSGSASSSGSRQPVPLRPIEPSLPPPKRQREAAAEIIEIEEAVGEVVRIVEDTTTLGNLFHGSFADKAACLIVTLDLSHVAQVHEQVQACPGCDIWLSLPCNDFCPWQEMKLHVHGQSFERKLHKEGRRACQCYAKP